MKELKKSQSRAEGQFFRQYVNNNISVQDDQERLNKKSTGDGSSPLKQSSEKNLGTLNQFDLISDGSPINNRRAYPHTDSVKDSFQHQNTFMRQHSMKAQLQDGMNNLDEIENQQKLTHKKEYFVPTGIKITQEDRIKNQNKIIKYPFMIISCESQIKTFWDLFVGVLVVYSCIVSPLDIAFTFEGIIRIIFTQGDQVTLGFFLIDIIVNLRTTYKDKDDNEIIDQKIIAKYYLGSSNFILDLASTLPIAEITEYFTSGSANIGKQYIRWLKQLKIFRILRLAKLTKYLSSESAKTYLSMMKIVFVFLMTYHWITCIWFFIVKEEYSSGSISDQKGWLPPQIREIGLSLENQESQVDDSELTKKFYEGFSNSEIYSSIFYALIILTIGNDIVPTSYVQAVLSAFVNIGGSFCTAILFGEIAVLIARLNQESNVYNDLNEGMRNRLRHFTIDKHITKKVSEYIDYCWQMKKFQENLVGVHMMSQPLQQSMYLHIHQELLKNMPLFQNLETSEVIWLIRQFKTNIYLPQDQIIKQGEYGNEMYFVIDGIVKIIVERDEGKQPLVYQKSKGDYFGELGVIIESRRTADVVAVDFTICQILTRESYYQFQKEFPEAKIRLKQGLTRYKQSQTQRFVDTLRIKFCPFLNQQETQLLVENYIEDVFISSYDLILRPKKKVNAMYILMMGKVSIMPNTARTMQIIYSTLEKSKTSDQKKNTQYNEYLDDDMENFPEDTSENLQQLMQNMLKQNDYFGFVDHLNPKVKHCEVENIFISLSGCQLAVLTEFDLQKMSRKNPQIFKKISANLNYDYLQKVNNLDSKNIDDNDSRWNKHLKRTALKVEKYITDNQVDLLTDELNINLYRQYKHLDKLNKKLIQELTSVGATNKMASSNYLKTDLNGTIMTTEESVSEKQQSEQRVMINSEVQHLKSEKKRAYHLNRSMPGDDN